MKLDLERARVLIEVVSTVNQWPKLKPIHDLAMAELEVIADSAVVELTELRVTEAKKAAAIEAEKTKNVKPPVPVIEQKPIQQSHSPFSSEPFRNEPVLPQTSPPSNTPYVPYPYEDKTPNQPELPINHGFERRV